MENKTNKTTNLILSKAHLVNFNLLVLHAQKLLNRKYFTSRTSFQKFIIKNIIYDEKLRIVSIFKDHLIMYEKSEILKRYYKYEESLIRLKKYYEFYSKYSKIFPNYNPLIESKYIYKNIHKKQKIINIQADEEIFKIKQNNRTRNNKLNHNKIFNSEVYETIEKNTKYFDSDIFDIHKYDLNDDSTSQIKNIINSIDKYKLFENGKEYHLENNKNLKAKNIIINNYYYNNNSILTKQSTIPSIKTQKQKSFNNEKMISPPGNNMLIGLKKKYKNQNYMNSSILKNLISSRLINNKNEKNVYNNKNKFIIEDDINTSRNNTQRNHQKNFKINLINQIKAMQNLTKEYPSTNKKLNYFNINSNIHKKNSFNNKSYIFNSIGRSSKKIELSLINKIFFKKTNCLSDRTSDYCEKFQSNQRFKTNHNILNKILKKNDLHKKKKFLNLKTCKLLLFSNNKNNSNEKEIKEKVFIKTERGNLQKKKSNENKINKITKINSTFLDIIKKTKKNKNIKSKLNKTKSFNNQLYKESYIIKKSILDKKKSTFITNIKLNLKNCQMTDENKFKPLKKLYKKKIFINQENNSKHSLSKYLYFTENSINNSNNESKILFNKKFSNKKALEKQNKYISQINSISFNNNTNIKKPSVIKIKGIQIKNFNKILNNHKEKSLSNSSRKTERISSKITNKNILLKIPKNINYNKIKINTNRKKNIIKISNKILDIKNNISNSNNYYFPESLTERDNS